MSKGFEEKIHKPGKLTIYMLIFCDQITVISRFTGSNSASNYVSINIQYLLN